MITDRRWPEHPLLYEINTWVWLRELSAAAGKQLVLAEIPQPALERIASLGFDGVWLMGVWERSPRAREIAASNADLRAEYERALPGVTVADIAGSPYAIHRYEVDAALGGPEALAVLRERLRQLGLRLLLDFVPNHLAIDHPWLDEYPDRFVQAGAERHACQPHNYFAREIEGSRRFFAHGRDPNFAGWTDTVQLDYCAPETRRAIRALLATVADQCDGVRCDMAMLIIPEVFVRTWDREFAPPNADFWSEAIETVRANHPGFLLVAEVYWDLEYRLQQLGFDYAYDKRLYDRLLNGDAESLRAHLRAPHEFQRRLTRFIENHDEPRAVAAFGDERSRAAAVLALTLPGMRLVHEGQIEGRSIRIPVQLGRRPDEPSDLVMQAHYERLLHAVSERVFHEGEWQLLDPRPAGSGESHRNFIAYYWSSHDQRRLVVVNWAADQGQCFLPLNVPALAGAAWRLRDRMSAAEYHRGGDELLEPGLYLDMQAYAYHVFDLVP